MNKMNSKSTAVKTYHKFDTLMSNNFAVPEHKTVEFLCNTDNATAMDFMVRLRTTIRNYANDFSGMEFDSSDVELEVTVGQVLLRVGDDVVAQAQQDLYRMTWSVAGDSRLQPLRFYSY